MVNIGQSVEVTVSGKKERRTVKEVTTVPFGTKLPEGWLDITTKEDEKNGIRVGIK